MESSKTPFPVEYNSLPTNSFSKIIEEDNTLRFQDYGTFLTHGAIRLANSSDGLPELWTVGEQT